MIKDKQTFNIKETAQQLVPDQLGRSSYLMAIGMMLIMLATIGAVYIKLPPTIPLFFSLPWGEARLSSKLSLLILPIISFAVVMINILLGRIASKLSPLLPRVLAVSSAVVVGMLLIALFGIIQSLIL